MVNFSESVIICAICGKVVENKKRPYTKVQERFGCLVKSLYFFLTRSVPPMIARINNTRNIKKSILAILAAPAAIPVKPNSAAIKAITKNITDQRNIIIGF